MANINSIAAAAAKIAQDRKKREEEKITPKIASTGSGGSVNDYLAEREARIKSGKQESDDVVLQRRQARLTAENSAVEQNVQRVRLNMAIDSIESQAMAAIQQRLQQGMGAFQATDRQMANPFNGQTDPVQYALDVQGLKGIGPQKTWRTEALELGKQAIEEKRQEYAQQGSVDEYAQKYRQTQSVYADESEREERYEKYVQEIPYLKDFSEVSQQASADTKRKRTEEEKEAYEREKAWAEVGGVSAGLQYKNQEQDLIDDYVSDEQLAVYNYLVNSGQQEYADKYWEQVKAKSQEQRNQDDVQRVRDLVSKAPEGLAQDVLGSLISIPANIGGTVQSNYYLASQELGEALGGKEQEIDPQDAAFGGYRVRDTLRADVTEDMPGWGKFLYDTGMSLGDTAAAGLLGGATGGAILMASGAAADTVRSVKERGGSDEQALTLGVISGAAEVLTEKMGFDRLGELIGGSKAGVLRNVLGAMQSEGLEEGVTEIANIVSDLLVMGDKSEYNALVSQYMAQGMSEANAHKQAVIDTLIQVGMATLGGTISGGVMSGGAAAIGSIANRANENYRSRTDALNYGARGDYPEYEPIRQQTYDNQQSTNPQSPLAGETDTSSVSRADTFPSEGKAQKALEKAEGAEESDIERMAREYGEDAGIFKAYYEDGDAEAYKRGFDAMWKAGQSGLPLNMLGGVSDQLTAGMSEGTRQAIYAAGRNKALNTITPGVKNLTTKKLTSDQRLFVRVWDAIGKEYGLEIDLVDDVKNANGAYSGGRRIVVSANAADGAYVQAAAHEAVHYIRSADADGYEVLKNVVLKHLTDEDSSFDLEYTINERMKQYTDAGMKNVDRAYALEEIVAEAVPTFFSDKSAVTAFTNENPTLAEKIRDFIYGFVKKIREIAERYMQSQNRDEITNLLGKTEALTEIAKTFDTALRGAQEKNENPQNEHRIDADSEDGVKYSKTMSFAEQLRKLREGEFPRNDHLYVMETPEVLQEIGLKELPILMTQRHAKSVMKVSGSDSKANYHGLTITMMKQLPEAIATPAMIIKAHGYDDRVIVITSLKDDAGNTVIAPIEMDGKGVVGAKYVDANILTTAYGKEQLKDMLLKAFMNDEVLYADKKRSDALAVNVGVQFPKIVRNGGFIHSISDFAPDVNHETKFSLKDIRYSLKSEEQKAIREAQEEDWKRVSAGQIMVQDLKVDSETVRRQAAGALNKGLRDKLNQQIGMAANRIKRDTESRYRRAELKEKLREIVKQYAANGLDTHTTLMAEALANQIIDQSTRKVKNEAAEAYADVRKQLREANISLTDTQRQEIENEYGSVAAYRRQVFGTMNVHNEGVTLESLWGELSGQHPEIFPPDTNEAQMPSVIAQFDQMMRPRYENIYGMDAEAAVTDLALRIQGDVLGMIGAKNAAHELYGTAEKFRNQIRKEYDAEIRARQEARVDEFQQIAGRLKAAKDKGDTEAQKKIMAEYRKALKKVDVKTAISEVRAAEKVRYQQRTENREAAQLRDKIAKRANELMDMLAGRTKGKRVPTKLQGLVIDVLESVDINGKRAADRGAETQRAAKFREKLSGIRKFYEEVMDSQSKGDSPEGLDGLMMTLSERNLDEILADIEVLGNGGAVTLRDMNSEQLKSLNSLLKEVKHTVESIGKLWRMQRYESVIQLGDASIAEMDSRGQQKITNSAAGGARDFFALDMMEPVSYGERLGEAGGAVIQALLDGEKEKFSKVREASEATEAMLKDAGVKGYDIGKWKKNVREVQLENGTARMTDAMLMGLYLTAKRPQGRQHLLASGMRIPTTDQTGAQVKAIPLTEKDLTYVAGLLSDKQRDMADRMGKYLSTTAAKWGNDVTQRMYLYDAFTEKNYWPITSDPNVLKTQEPEGERAFNAIINAGFTKPVNQKANNAVIIMDAFDVFGGHIGEMASYAGYAEVMTDTLAWLNYKRRDSESGLIQGSVKESMESLLGKGGIQYLTKLVQDINGARRGGDNVQLNKLLGNYKKAAVMGKIRVAIQQPTSIVRAAAEINPLWLIRGLRPTKGFKDSKSLWNWLRSNGTIEEMQKWSSLAWWKANGNYEIGVGKGMDEILWGKTSVKDTIVDEVATQGGLVDPGKMDDLTWAHMWLAVKDEIRAKRKDLTVGSDEYFRAVAERFEYIMDRTQVVDTVMHRSDLMRSKDGLNKMLTSFMGEPTKSYNMLMRAVMETGRKPKSASSYKRLGRAMLTFAASAAATSAMTALYDAFRYRDDEDEIWTYLSGQYWGDVWEQFLKAFAGNVNPLNTVAIVKDVVDMAFNDGDVPTVMALEGISDAVDAAQTVMNYFKGNNSRKSTVYGAIKPILTAASSSLGLPLNGILANVETIGRVFDPKWMQTKSEYATQSKAYEKLYEAMKDGNEKKALEIRTQLAKGLYGANPKTPKEIDSGIGKNLALDDERILKYWQMREKGDQYKEMVALRKEIQKDGFTEEHVVYAGNSIESLLTDQYRQLLEDGEGTKAKELKEHAAKYGMVLEEAEAKDMTEELEPKMFQYDHLFAAIRNGELDDVEGVAGVMELESDAENPAEAIRSQVSSEFREEYIEAVRGGNSRKVSDLEKKLDLFDIDEEDRARWLRTDRYDDLGEALEAGRTSKADEYIEELRESGVSDDDIASSVSSRFKQTYIDHVVNGEDDEAEELAEMLRGLGLVTTKGKNKYRQDVLDGWVEDWYKAQEK